MKRTDNGMLFRVALDIANRDRQIPKEIAPVLRIVPRPMDLLNLAVIRVPVIPPIPETACREPNPLDPISRMSLANTGRSVIYDMPKMLLKKVKPIRAKNNG